MCVLRFDESWIGISRDDLSNHRSLPKVFFRSFVQHSPLHRVLHRRLDSIWDLYCYCLVRCFVYVSVHTLVTFVVY